MHAWSHAQLLINQHMQEEMHAYISISVWLFIILCTTAPAPLAQPIANAAQYGNSRIQPIMLERLACMLTYPED